MKILLRSVDVLHNFYVPQFRAKMDSVPGVVTYYWFEPNKIGEYEVLCAEYCGVGVTDFSIGFGKEIFGWNDKSGTRWKICWIPLGGYVKFFGDRNVFSQSDQEELLKKYNKDEQHKLFVTKPLYQRSLIVAGGPFANFILAIFIFL